MPTRPRPTPILLLSVAACAAPIEAEPIAAPEVRQPVPPASERSVPAPDPAAIDHTDLVRRVIAGYPRWGPADSELHWAPGKCDLPTLGEYHLSDQPTDGRLHGSKLYLVYALDIARFGRDAWGFPHDDVRLGTDDDPYMAQAIVKETFHPDPDRPPTYPIEFADPVTGRAGYPPLALMHEGKPLYPGDPQGLFVMIQLRTAGPDTDHGWIYATTDARGTLTASGRIEECMGCHRREADRVFGFGAEPKRY